MRAIYVVLLVPIMFIVGVLVGLVVLGWIAEELCRAITQHYEDVMLERRG